MKKSENLKELVRDKYAGIAVEKDSCCCGKSKNNTDLSVFNESYENQPGYVKDADLNLGCGVPTEYAGMKPGDRVLDLGCGAGNDCFVARSIVGEQGQVTGLDFTNEMIDKARKNARKLGFQNVDFLMGDIEDIPVEKELFDVVISNCVLNLVPGKKKAFSEIMRVLKPGGRFCVSDIVLKGTLPDKVREAASLYAGCVSGALQKEEYMAVIDAAHFRNVAVKKERQIDVPDAMFLDHISMEELDQYKASGTGIYSITVTGEKPVYSEGASR